MKTLVYAAGMFCLCGLGCKKGDNVLHEPQLPAATQDGRNILACRVNGVVHIYSGKSSLRTPNGVDYDRYADKIILFADNIDYDDLVKVSIFDSLDNLAIGLKYSLSNDGIQPYGEYHRNGSLNIFETQSGSGWIQFSRLDTAVASGTFAYTAFRNVDSVRITEGRFDIAE